MIDVLLSQKTPELKAFLSPLFTFSHCLEGCFIIKTYLVMTICLCLQGSPVQEERNGPLPPPKPQEPSSNHTAPVPGELSVVLSQRRSHSHTLSLHELPLGKGIQEISIVLMPCDESMHGFSGLLSAVLCTSSSCGSCEPPERPDKCRNKSNFGGQLQFLISFPSLGYTCGSV